MVDSLQQPASNQQYGELKSKLHTRLLDEIDLDSLNRIEIETARNRISQFTREILEQDRTPLARAERERLIGEILDELFGLGPLEPLLADTNISDILVNGSNSVYIEKRGLLEKVNVSFDDDAHVMRIIDRIVSRVGRRIDESTPMVDARLMDGSRVNAIIAPLALDGPTLSIRRFGHEKLKADDLLRYGTLTENMMRLLEAAVKGKLNVLISGGTGSGKTTLLNVLSSNIPDGERIITIEDAAELDLKQDHVVRLETRPPNLEGKGAIAQRQLVINALRMRPDRIVVGEVRGEEAIDMLQAMNTGHEGSLTTIHANSPRDALTRLETMVSMANLRIPDKAIRQQIASAINLVVQGARLVDGSRKIIAVSEITGMEGPTITMQDLFVYQRQGFDENMKVRGQFRPTGIRPKFSEKLFGAGIRLPMDMFEMSGV
jgi:pilus assembly protein CpaF